MPNGSIVHSEQCSARAKPCPEWAEAMLTTGRDDVHDEHRSSKEPAKNPSEEPVGELKAATAEKLRTATPLAPAVSIFKRLTKKSPNDIQRTMIEQGIPHDPESLRAWESSITQWLASGWSAKNVKGMLDFHAKGGSCDRRESRVQSRARELGSVLTAASREELADSVAATFDPPGYKR